MICRFQRCYKDGQSVVFIGVELIQEINGTADYEYVVMRQGGDEFLLWKEGNTDEPWDFRVTLDTKVKTVEPYTFPNYKR